MSEYRYDIRYKENGPDIDFHFCRSWDEDGGCYGTNPHHGYTFEEAALQLAKWYSDKAQEWLDATEEQWLNENACFPDDGAE